MKFLNEIYCIFIRSANAKLRTNNRVSLLNTFDKQDFRKGEVVLIYSS